MIQYAAYTGPIGADGQDYAIDETAGDLGFVTTRALAPREGLTIAVAWPKGIVNEPDAAEKIGYLLGDNRGLVVALCGLIVLLGYYLLAWLEGGAGSDRRRHHSALRPAKRHLPGRHAVCPEDGV